MAGETGLTGLMGLGCVHGPPSTGLFRIFDFALVIPFIPFNSLTVSSVDRSSSLQRVYFDLLPVHTHRGSGPHFTF